MWLEKEFNKWLIKRAIWRKYVYEIEAEEKADSIIKRKTEEMSKFFKWWVDEMKKEVKKVIEW